MGNRLSKIYTRTGDKGTTGMGDGTRVDKDSLIIECFGVVDELNSHIGLILAYEIPQELSDILTGVQHDLFDLGGELCLPGHTAIKPDDITRLETWLDRLNQDLPPLKEFILPAGGPATASTHIARTICRRAERRICSLNKQQPDYATILAYLNRLSDLLFVIARVCVRFENGKEVYWQPGYNK